MPTDRISVAITRLPSQAKLETKTATIAFYFDTIWRQEAIGKADLIYFYYF